MENSDLTRRTIIDVDPNTNETIKRELEGDERALYYFGENVGLLAFQSWFPTIAHIGHQLNLKTYDFPVRLKFVADPFDSHPFFESPPRSSRLECNRMAAPRARTRGTGRTGNSRRLWPHGQYSIFNPVRCGYSCLYVDNDVCTRTIQHTSN